MKRLFLIALLSFYCGSANSATWYAKTAGNWDVANAWNSQRDGLGTDQSHPLPAADSADLNGKAMTLNVDVTITTITAGGGTGQLTVSGDRTITGNLLYGGTLTSGMVVLPTASTLTVVGVTVSTGTGYTIQTAGSGMLYLSSTTSSIIMTAGSGRTVSFTGTGVFTSTGGIVITGGTGQALYMLTATSGLHAIVGDIDCRASATATTIRYGGGTLHLYGNMVSSGTTVALTLSGGGTFMWNGARTLAAGKDCYIQITSGILNISDLVLSNYGRLIIQTNTYTGLSVGTGASKAQINNLSSDAQAVVSQTDWGIVTNFSTGGGGGSFTFAQ